MPGRSLAEVARGGQTLEVLEAMRDQIAADLEACTTLRDKAPLYLRLADTLARIDELKPPELRGDAVDEIAARRVARGAGPAAGSSRTKRPG